jgi:hypothetical protein
MSAGIRNIKIKFTGDTKGLDQAAGQGEKQLSKFKRGFKNFNRVAVKASTAVAAGLAFVVKDSVGLSRQMDDMDSKAKTVFGSQLKQVRKWGDANKRAFGLSRREVVGLATNMADLLKPMGFTSAEAAKMSTNMLDLAGALSKWSGGQRTAAEVSDILTKAMLGERDELKSLGISITEAEVSAKLAAKGQEKLTGAALQQAKALATQELVLAKSTDAQKAWESGGRKAAEAQNGMKTSIQELRETVATLLGPAIIAVTALLETFAKWVDRNRGVAITLGSVLVGLAGFVFVANAAYKVWIATTRVATAAKWLFNAALVATRLSAVRSTVALVASKVVLFAAAAASKAAAAATWLFNAALKASPIGRIITLVVAIGTALVTAYQKSETFRRIVKGVFSAVATAVGWAIEKIKTLIGWIKDGIEWVKNLARDVGGFFSGNFQGKIQEVAGKLPKRAHGGPVSAGRTYMVGERGPELFTSNTSGRITPNHELGGGFTVQNLEIKAFSDRFSLRQVQNELAMHGVA